MYVISASGAKNTDIWSQNDVNAFIGDGEADFNGISLDRVAGNTPMFQVVRVDGGTVRYEARTATGDIYDYFVLTKSPDGSKQLSEGEEAFGESRLFSNTGPYRDWYDLR